MTCRQFQLTTIVVALVVFSSCGSKPEVSNELTQTSEYLRAFGQILHEKKMPTLQDEAAKQVAEFDRVEKVDANAARLRLANTMDSLFERISPLISKLEKLTPPEKLREHSDVNLECTKMQAQSIKQMAEALRSQDSKTYKSQMKRFKLDVLECNNRIEAALQKAGYNSAEDIRKAIAESR